MPRRENKIADTIAVYLCLKKSAGGCVKAGTDNIFRFKSLAEAIHGIAFSFVHAIISAYPFRGKVGRVKQRHLK